MQNEWDYVLKKKIYSIPKFSESEAWQTWLDQRKSIAFNTRDVFDFAREYFFEIKWRSMLDPDIDIYRPKSFEQKSSDDVPYKDNNNSFSINM